MGTVDIYLERGGGGLGARYIKLLCGGMVDYSGCPFGLKDKAICPPVDRAT